jgi:hypothetical protein
MVTGFEIDSRWGDGSQISVGQTRNIGGAIETDQVNLETKQVYLDFNIPKTPINAKVGLLPFNDAFKGTFLNADVAAALLTAKMDKSTFSFGWLRAYDNQTPLGNNGNCTVTTAGTITCASTAATATAIGTQNTNTPPNNTSAIGANDGRYSLDVTTLDYKFAVNKDLTIGASDYIVYDKMLGGQGVNILNTFGVNASANVGPATIDGFVLAQYGDMPYNGVTATTGGNTATPSVTPLMSDKNKVGRKVTAFAANVAAKVKAGPGTARGSFLWTTGDRGNGGSSHAFQGVNQYGAQTANYSAAQMTMLMLTTKHAMNTDRALVGSTTNAQQGVVGAFFGYDLAIDKMFGSLNLGMAMTDKNNNNSPTNKNTTKRNGSQYIGTEVNLEAGYKLYDNLSASVVGGYVMLGDYYKDSTTNQKTGVNASPDNPWKTQLVLSYTF